MPDLSDRPATVAEFRALRDATGLGAFPEGATETALRNSLYAVWLRDDAGTLIGMGRLVGDGGCFAQITDIAVHPSHQRTGLGSQIMQALMDWAGANLPPDCYISLIADPGAEALYAKFGFSPRHGMARSAG